MALRRINNLVRPQENWNDKHTHNLWLCKSNRGSHLSYSSACHLYATIGFAFSNYLFPGSNQYDRYAKILGRALKLPAAQQHSDSYGYVPSDFGSQSARKGEVTFVSDCITACYSASSIILELDGVYHESSIPKCDIKVLET